MTYDEAEQMVAGNLHLTSVYSKHPDFPFYVRHLLIVPIGADAELRSKIYNECLSNGFDNKEALNALGVTDTDFEVIIMGFSGNTSASYSLEKYLEESQYKS